MFLTVYGNPVTGFTAHGPFSDQDAAVDFAESMLTDETWWLMPLHDPRELGANGQPFGEAPILNAAFRERFPVEHSTV